MFSTSSSTSKIANHLWTCQRANIDGKHKPPASNALITAYTINSRQSAATTPLVGLGIVDRLKLLLIKWIVSMHILLSIVENQFFWQLILWFSPTLTAFVSKDYYTMRNQLMEAYRQKQTVMKSILKESKSNVHLFFDLQTSNNNIALLAVVGHLWTSNTTYVRLYQLFVKSKEIIWVKTLPRQSYKLSMITIYSQSLGI